MSSVNKVIIIGNLGSDPELRSVGDSVVCNFSVATSRKWKDDSGELQSETEWHRIAIWGRSAEACNTYLAKGKSVYVEGRLKTRKWQDKDGNDRYSTDIVAYDVQFLSPKSDDGGGYQRNDSRQGSGDRPDSGGGSRW